MKFVVGLAMPPVVVGLDPRSKDAVRSLHSSGEVGNTNDDNDERARHRRHAKLVVVGVVLGVVIVAVCTTASGNKYHLLCHLFRHGHQFPCCRLRLHPRL